MAAPRKVGLRWTAALRESALLLVEDPALESKTKAQVQFDIDRESVSVDTLRLLKTSGSLFELVRGSSLSFEGFKKIEEPSEEVLRRREELNRKKQEREYNQMVYGSDKNPDIQDEKSMGNQYSSMKTQMTISANMIVSVFVMFGIGYMAGKTVSDSETTRMVCGLVASIGIMIVEMSLFIVRAVQMENTFEGKRNEKPRGSFTAMAGLARQQYIEQENRSRAWQGGGGGGGDSVHGPGFSVNLMDSDSEDEDSGYKSQSKKNN